MTDHFSKAIDLREELNLILDNITPHWVALRTAQLDQPCPECIKRVKPQYNTPPGSCMKCLNTGHLFVDKIINTYSYQASAGRDYIANLGKISAETVIYIIKHDSRPKQGDYICELDLDESTGIPRQPFRIRRIFSIEDSKEFRGDDGRIEYFKLYCEENNLDRGINIW